jgi:hypothetical protein
MLTGLAEEAGMTAGYSGTPLPRKLGLEEGMAVAFLELPDQLPDLIGPIWTALSITDRLHGHQDLVMVFVTSASDLARRTAALKAAIAPDGMIWVAWPKKASKIPTDITEDVIREIVLPTGLVDVKVCAIDQTWSGLKLVIRRDLRVSPARASTPPG